MPDIAPIKLLCPQPHCHTEMETSYPEYPDDWDERRTVGGIRVAWRCPKCNIRVLVSNPNELERGTIHRVHRTKTRNVLKYNAAGSGLWIPKDV